ncbi:MAG: hypothetical protein KIS90_05740, partial [Phenylobacterium sp.]|nr:hypothetical protein [Phenylobacterium sp.]
MGDLAARLKAVSSAQAGTAVSSKVLANAGLNLGRQVSDLGVQFAGAAASGNPLKMVMMAVVQQGPQIADAFAVAKQQGASFDVVMKGLATSVGAFLKASAPLLAVGATAAAVFLLWKKQSDDLKAAMKGAAEVAANFADVQDATRDALAGAASFAEKYQVANVDLTAALDDLLISQNKAYGGALASIDANDEAGKAAARRAENERLLTVRVLKRAQAEASARIKEGEAEIKQAEKAGRSASFFATVTRAQGVGEFPGAVDPMASGDAAEAAALRKANVTATRQAVKEEKAYEAALAATIKATMEANLVIPKSEEARRAEAEAIRAAAKEQREAANAAKEAARAEEEFDRAIQGVLQSLETGGERQLREMNEKILVLRKALDAGKISTDQFRDAVERLQPTVVDLKDAQKALRVQFEATPGDLDKAIGKMDRAADKARDLADAFGEVSFSLKDMLRSVKSGDLGSLILNIQGLSSGLGTLLGGGTAGQLQIAALAANTIGGSTGRTIGASLGVAASGVGLGAFAAT